MKNKIPSITGLRALSIFIVIFYHLQRVGMLGSGFSNGLMLDDNFGVNVFFVISGFLITTLLIAEEKRNGSISFKNFYIRRAFRIFPAYYFILLVYFVLQLFSVLHFSGQSWLSSLFYYKYVTGKDTDTMHFWSLSVEEQFYLIWPLIFLCFKKGRVYWAFGVIFLVFICRLCAYYTWLPFPILKEWIFIFQRIDAIMIGCLFAIYRERIEEWMNNLIRRKAFLPLILLAILLNSHWLSEWNMHYKLHLGFILVPLGAGTAIGTIYNLLIGILIIFSISRKNVWSGFLNLPFMNFIGRLSYSLYLWQQLFIFSHRIGVLSRFPLNLICIFLVALFSYYVIEKPFLRLKSRFEPDRKPEPVLKNGQDNKMYVQSL